MQSQNVAERFKQGNKNCVQMHSSGNNPYAPSKKQSCAN